MKKVTLLFFSFILLSLQGCQTPFFETGVPAEDLSLPAEKSSVNAEPSIPPEAFSVPVEQAQIYNLFIRGMRYSELDESQLKIACKQLKEDYASQADWQIAWLLVYAVNHNFSCISLNKASELLHAIEADPSVSNQLQWINHHQINVLDILQKSLTNKANLMVKLKKAQAELEQENNKIEELKAIESDINKKLDDDEMQ